nr:retrovirus-related Pol polyprotein from transposon TNT 1-94 [Tanacetum cinerariifolium]
MWLDSSNSPMLSFLKRLERELGLRELEMFDYMEHVFMELIEIEGCDEHWGSIVGSSESTSFKKSLRCWFGSSDRSLWNEHPFCTNQMVLDRRDADHAGCHDDCKSTSGGLQFLGKKLVSWSSKKQDCTAISTADAEFLALGWHLKEIHVTWAHLEKKGQDHDFTLSILKNHAYRAWRRRHKYKVTPS